jgi:hypothetical protein
MATCAYDSGISTSTAMNSNYSFGYASGNRAARRAERSKARKRKRSLLFSKR